jgi:hypothetical protein
MRDLFPLEISAKIIGFFVLDKMPANLYIPLLLYRNDEIGNVFLSYYCSGDNKIMR